ncbi:MAG: hypothetical protein BWX72_01354 [Firmicutes bacterium ADurb.Bin080]|nr:MAG: hypothetical protein BWX72_01354 [Firmicutes bacterium ADurb.Bin080]
MVLSIISTIPYFFESLSNFSKSATLPQGFAIVSKYMNFVLSSIIFSNTSSLSSRSTNLHSIPSLLMVTLKRLYDPPYILDTDMKLSPLSHKFKIAVVMAAIPDAADNAPTPPSSSATFFSRT